MFAFPVEVGGPGVDDEVAAAAGLEEAVCRIGSGTGRDRAASKWVGKAAPLNFTEAASNRAGCLGPAGCRFGIVVLRCRNKLCISTVCWDRFPWEVRMTEVKASTWGRCTDCRWFLVGEDEAFGCLPASAEAF